jgi:hypothetical protein
VNRNHPIYRMTSNVEAMRRLFGVVDVPNLPLFPEICPKQEAPIIRADGHQVIECIQSGPAEFAEALDRSFRYRG